MQRAFQDLGRTLDQWFASFSPFLVATLLWLAFSLTGVLFPAATAGLFLVTNRIAYGKPVPGALFTAGMRLYWRVTLRWIVIYGAGIALLVLLFSAAGEFLQAAVVLAGLWWSLFNLLALALLIEQPHKRALSTLWSTLLLTAAAPLYMLVIGSAITLLLMIMLEVYVVPLLPFAPSLIALGVTRAVLTQTQLSGLTPDPERAVRVPH